MRLRLRLDRQPASTKADHVVRSRALLHAQDLRAAGLRPGGPALVQGRLVCTCGQLETTGKRGLALLSKEARDELGEEDAIEIQALPDAPATAGRVVLAIGGGEDWRGGEEYVARCLHRAVLGVGTRVGVLWGGKLNVLRVVEIEPATASAVRVDKTETTCAFFPPSDEDAERRADEPFAGLDEEFRVLIDLATAAFAGRETDAPRPPRGLLLFGPSGTGKTLLAERAARALKARVIRPHDFGSASKTIAEAYASPANARAIRPHDFGSASKTIAEAYASPRGTTKRLLLLEEADVLFSENPDALGALLRGTDKRECDGTTFLVACTERPEALPAALRRPGRLDEEIEILPPDATRRASILRAHLDRRAVASPDDAAVASVANRLHGFVGADIKLLVSEAWFRAVHERGAQTLSLDDLIAASARVAPSCLRQVQVQVPRVLWTDVGGMDQVKRSIREAVELPLKNPEAFARLGIRPPQGLLLYGPPGCSKTMLAKAVATESEMNFIAVKGPELLSKWVGDSEKAVQATFRRARQSKPCVVFFDEIDALAAGRSASTSSVGDRVTSQLLQELDGIEPRSGIVVLCATSRPDLLDPALLRPGRIDRCVYVPPPDGPARKQILRMHAARVPHDFEDALLDDIDTQGFSGAEVASICKEAALRALERDPNAVSVSLDEIRQAAARVKPQITRAVLDFYQTFRDSRRDDL